MCLHCGTPQSVYAVTNHRHGMALLAQGLQMSNLLIGSKITLNFQTIGRNRSRCRR